ncbi:MAG: MerR family transcriptional regulator [Rhodospirillales bacterium]|nr:MAG: MerR family transcriptional regulator [Rhodospirillales bacterium]
MTATGAEASGGIGWLARESGCHVETVRYYERVGLLPRAPRTAGGHRVYGETHLRRLVFIRRSRELGFGLAEVRELLRLADDAGGSCDTVHGIADRHLTAIRGRIDDLRRMEQTMAAMVDGCSTGRVPECRILDALFKPQGGRSPGRSMTGRNERRRRTGGGQKTA